LLTSSSGGSEDLAAVPFDVGGVDGFEAWLWGADGALGQGEDHFLGRRRPADELRGDGDRAVGGQAEDALVEKLVVDGAQAQSVGDVVRSFERPPADVGGVETDSGAVQPAVVLAERTAVLVSHQDVLAERGISPDHRARRDSHRVRCAVGLQVQAGELADVGVQGGFEIGLQQVPREPDHQVGVVGQGSQEVRVEPAGCLGVAKATEL
jgi:hypothetical protein